MNKIDFVLKLTERLDFLPREEAKQRVDFYVELIDDRMEEGLTEEEAVAAVGSVGEIVAQTLADIPFSRIVKEKVRGKRRLKAWEIILLALGAPIWLSLLISAFAVILSLYISLWAVIISLWAVFASLCGCAFGLVLAGIIFAITNDPLIGIAVEGAALVSAGLSIFMFYGCKAATTGILRLTKRFALWIKLCFVKKEEA